MQLDHAVERGEFRVFVDQRGVEPLRRCRHERIRERNLVRRLQLSCIAAQRLVRMVPADGQRLDVGQPPLCGLLALFLPGDVFNFGEAHE